MSNLSKEEHLAGSHVESRSDGYHLILQHPCTDANKEKFDWELEQALEASLRLGSVTVLWVHNGVTASTDWELRSGGAWAYFTEANAHKAN